MLDVDHPLPGTYYSLGNTYNYIYQYERAIPEFERSLEIYKKWDIKPMWVYNYTFLGVAYHKTGQFKKEKKLYKKAEKDFPDDQDLIFMQAILSFTEGDTIMANHYIDKYTSIRKEKSESEADIIAGLAWIYSEAGIPDKAEAYLREAVSLEPESQLRMNELAYFLIDKDRNIDEGLDLVDTILKLDPDNYSYLHTKGWGLYKQGKYQEALDILQKSWDLRRKNAIYDHDAYLHLEEAKKAIVNQKY
jgi:tetratricopeptide (TPR) repeat protein